MRHIQPQTDILKSGEMCINVATFGKNVCTTFNHLAPNGAFLTSEVFPDYLFKLFTGSKCRM